MSDGDQIMKDRSAFKSVVPTENSVSATLASVVPPAAC
jgi:hypothetical protein